MYSHPWEYCEQAAHKSWNIPGYVVRHAGAEQAGRLADLIRSLKAEGTFITFTEYLQ